MRINFEFTAEQVRKLKGLQEKTGSASMKELFNNAMSLLEWTVDETINGNEIASINTDDKHYRVLIAPALQRAAQQRQLQKV